jgi:hypothetical protein
MEKNYKQLAVDLNKIVGFQIDFDDSLGDNLLTLIQKSLKERIADLLRNDYSTLLNILYRVDVSERKVYECMEHDTLDGIADCLTTAIIERQLMKIELRGK